MTTLKKFYQIFEDKKHKVFQIRSKNDLMIAEFQDDVDRQIFTILSENLNHGKSVEKIVQKYLSDFPSEKVSQVVEELNNYKVLETTSELNLTSKSKHEEQLIFWSFWEGEQNPSSDFYNRQEIIEQTNLLLIGEGNKLKILKEKAALAGYANINFFDQKNKNLDEPQIRRIVEDSDFIIIDTDFWVPNHLEIINSISLELNKPWILLRGSNQMKVYVGPLFIPHESACYGCLTSRLKSHMEFVSYFEEFEDYLKEQNLGAKSEGGFMPMYDLAANMAIMESIKYVTSWTTSELFNSFITIDFQTYDFTKHNVLKIPNCRSCRPEIDFTASPWLEPLTIRK